MKTRHSKKGVSGYTAIEMVVVMGIFAVLSALGAGAWFSVRNQSRVDNAAQEYISAVRDAQNKAFAVEKDSTGGVTRDTVGWAVAVADGGTQISRYSYNNGNNDTNPVFRTSSSINISPVRIRTSPNTQYIAVFTTPLGKGYSTGYTANLFSSSQWSIRSEAASRPVGDFYPKTSINNGIGTIVFDLGGYTRTVILEPNGDVYAQ